MNYLSLFSGIGGFEYGIQQSNKNEKLTNIGYSEIDKYAENIYRKHFPNYPRLGDATKINAEELPDFDLLVGGFPCQAFSIAGKRRGFDDTRGTLFFEIARILKEKKPRYFLLENVKNLLSHDKGLTFKIILRTFGELGYDVQWEILNSKNFGVPQNRERIYIKGYFRTKCRSEIFRIGYNDSKINVNKPKQLNKNKPQAQRIYDSEGLSKTLVGNGGGQGAKMGLYKINSSEDNQIKKVGNCSKSGKHGNGTVVSTDGISPSLLARDYKDPKRIIEYDKSNNKGFTVRKLTPKECERLQGFPDDWTKYGVDGSIISDTQRYKCCGNAVTTNVITYIMNNWNLID